MHTLVFYDPYLYGIEKPKYKKLKTTLLVEETAVPLFIASPILVVQSVGTERKTPSWPARDVCAEVS